MTPAQHRVPTHLRDRWLSRPDPEPGTGRLYWHVLLGAEPDLRAAAGAAQRTLARFDGLHLTPPHRLHLTVTDIAASAQVPADLRTDLVQAVRARLADTGALTATVGEVLYHPEAIALRVEPAAPIVELALAVVETTRAITGHPAHDPAPVPHVTLAYATAAQPAQPIIDALGQQIPTVTFRVGSVALVEQRGPERRWDWAILDHVHLHDR